jgi:sulfite reductase beta subunit-like hemoprotein
MDTNKLLKALEDESNETLFNFTTKKLREMTFNILKELDLPKDETMELMKKLKEYKYIDEMSDLKYGSYLRWIPIDDPENIFLTKGAIFCEVKITDDGVFIICKNHGYTNKHFRLSMDKNLIFQKLTSQELVLLSALDHLSK